jgi:uncharacterized oligopeptide transporter (OPT) family protein
MPINRNNGSPPRSVNERESRLGTGSAADPPEPMLERDELSAEDSTASNRIRQGVTGHNVRYVLLLSIAGVVLAFILIYVAFTR